MVQRVECVRAPKGLGDSFDSKAGLLLPQRHDAQALETHCPSSRSLSWDPERSIALEALRDIEKTNWTCHRGQLTGNGLEGEWLAGDRNYWFCTTEYTPIE